MCTIDFIRSGLRQLHQTYDESIADLSDDQLHWIANENGVSAAFVLWHYVRTEDNIINFVLQGKSTVWIEGGWYERLGLHRTAQGTGMSLQDAQALRISDKGAFQDYMRATWKATEGYLATLTDDDLRKTITVRPLGEMPAINAVGTICLTHGFAHSGEIAHLRGLMGLRGFGW